MGDSAPPDLWPLSRVNFLRHSRPLAFLGNEIDYANATPGPWHRNILSSDGLRYAGGNALLAIATVGLPTILRSTVNAETLPGNFMVPSWPPLRCEGYGQQPWSHFSVFHGWGCPRP